MLRMIFYRTVRFVERGLGNAEPSNLLVGSVYTGAVLGSALGTYAADAHHKKREPIIAMSRQAKKVIGNGMADDAPSTSAADTNTSKVISGRR